MTTHTGLVLAERYRLTEQIGAGGSADVFAAEDLVLGRDVAVKLFRPDTELSDQERIFAEMQTVAGLNHPGVVTVFDAGYDDQEAPFTRAFLVMELVDGKSLRDRLADGPLSPGAIAALARSLADTLAYVHGRGLVHRDIKPANILLTADPDGDALVAKLSDFGVALRPGAARMTDVGLTVGSANYLAPEQVTSSDLGPAVDVYAFGLILLEAFTAEQAFPGRGLDAAMARLDHPPQVPPRIPAPWAALIGRMTSLEPAARPTASDLVRTLSRMPEATGVSQATVVLGEAPTRAAIGARPAADSTRVLPARSVARSLDDVRDAARQWLGRGPRLVAIAAVALTCLVIATLVLTTRHHAPTPAPSVSYPPVAGPMASPIKHLEQVIG